jgi:hypothetical protein
MRLLQTLLLAIIAACLLFGTAPTLAGLTAAFWLAALLVGVWAFFVYLRHITR